MKVLRFYGGKREWTIPVDELSADMKEMLRLFWREFIHELEDAEDENRNLDKVDLTVVAVLERLFIAPDAA